MKRLLIVLLVMACSPAWAATYFVRALGNDTFCNGLTDADCSGISCVNNLPNCAYATPTKALAVINCTTPDRITMRDGTYTGAFTIPAICQAPSDASRLIIEGNASDPNAVTLDGSASAITLYSVGGTGSVANRSKFITLKNFRIVSGTDYGIQFNGTHEGINIDNLRIDGPNTQCCASGGGAVAIYHGPNQGCWGCKITNTIITGTGTTTKRGITGTDAQAINFTPLGVCAACTISETSYFQDNTITNMLGSFFGGNYSDSYVERNIGNGTVSQGDDGGFQLYNTTNAVVRYNLFKNVRCDEAVNYGVFFSIRSTNESDATKVAHSYIYNNTIIGSTVATDHTLGEKYFYMDEVIHPDSQKTYFINNVVQNNFGVDLSTYGSLSGFADKWAAQVADCPTALIEFGHNIIYNIGWRDNGSQTPFDTLWVLWDQADCAVDPNTMGNLVGTNPSLETTNWTPDSAGDPSCGAGDTSFTAPDGDKSKSWIGYAQGSCVVAAGTRKIVNLIISKLAPGVQPVELWRRPIAPGEALGIWEDQP